MISTISGWIMSIAGVICLSVIVELILPNGQMNRYIKGIFSFIIILVIIMPVPKLFNMKLDLSNVFSSEEIYIQEDYLYQLNLNKIISLKEGAEDKLKEKGYEGCVVSISADIFAQKIDIKSVSVDISSLRITEKAPHKNILDAKRDIQKIILEMIKVKEVYFDE